ncbi:MAG TPA: GNAT family N-acetyltransferase [Allosphingosinicella sp.]|jgi:predicted GNAT family acetyltransferase
MAHPLDRPVWNALTTRQSHLAVGDRRALRYDLDYALFAAAAAPDDESLRALSALVPSEGAVGLVEAEEWPLPPGLTADRRPTIHQMVANRIEPGDAVAHLDLGEEDAAEMLALARLTDPGPFFARTHRLGRFVGLRVEGRLVAMAGERMKIPGFSEVSAVCTHPEYRGRGLAGGLMRIVASRIVGRGESAFLHTYAANESAVRLYESLGFRFRAEVRYTILRRL